MLWKMQLPELPLARLTRAGRSPEAVELLGMGETLQEHLQKQEWHFVLHGALFLWSTVKLQVESRAIVEILADLQSQRQQIPPGHWTVGYTAENKAQIPAAGQTPSIQPQAPNSASYCKSLAENSPLPHTCPQALKKNRERLC